MIKITLNAFALIIFLFNNNSLIAQDELIAKKPIESNKFIQHQEPNKISFLFDIYNPQGYLLENIVFDDTPDFLKKCNDIKTPDKDGPLKQLFKDVPKILLSSLLSKAQESKKGSPNLELKTISNARLYIPSNITSLSNEQKVVLLSSALIGGAIVSSLYLKDNEIDFTNNFDIPLKGAAGINNVLLQISGAKVGLNSGNPFMQLATTLNLKNNLSLSLAGGSSMVTKEKSEGAQNARLSLTLPLDYETVSHRLILQGGTQREYTGILDNGNFKNKSLNGAVTYSISPNFKNIHIKALKNLDATVSINLISASQNVNFDQEDRNIETINLNSSAKAYLKYKISDLITHQASIDLSASGGGAYNVDGQAIPFYGVSLNLSIYPKTGNKN
jgi:hypothetical protein